LALLAAGLASAQQPIPVIFDTDIGDDIDDALALALVLQSPEVDLRLVTTVADDVDSRTRLAWKELGAYGRQDVALATGASEPLLDPRYPTQAAQFKILTPQDQPPEAAHRNGVGAITQTLLASGQKVTILALGPLTNIALALKLEPRIKEKIARIVLMGGAYFPPKREYNIYRDRIAADIVFSSGLPITAVGLDVTQFFRLESQDVERIHDAHNAGSEFLSQLIALWQEGDRGKLPVLYDPVASGAAIKPALVQTLSGTVEVDTREPASFGVTRFLQGKGTVGVARGVTASEFLQLFMDRLTAAPRGK
jgi:inosine-uridine nucleoside N-ribohydrolase